MYSRANPSQRYQDLLVQYRTMHREGERFLGIPAQETFPGLSLPAQAPRIRALIERTGATNVLDYGAGKGLQYGMRDLKLPNGDRAESIQDYWDVDFIECYDPCYVPFSKLPDRTFDGVVSTDVLEHCPEEDVEWILDEMFSFAERFLFANVACYPAKKRLPTGENAHCTIKPPEWWAEVIGRVAARHPDIQWEIWIQFQEPGPNGPKLVETRLASKEHSRT